VPSVPPGKLVLPQHYNDDYFGWPVAPVRRQHPIRSTFLDPRADDSHGAIYHMGIDIAVDDEEPERGAPHGRTHRVYAIEGGVVTEATPPGVRGHVHLGHFGYGHVDATVRVGERVVAGQMLGWTWLTTWHVHLSEFLFRPDGRTLVINPLRPGGKLRPYVDRLGPMIHELRAYTPALGSWGRRRTNVAVLRPAGRRLDRTRLKGKVDLRVRTADRQSFQGWFSRHPYLAAPHHVYRLGFVLAHRPSGRIVLRKSVFWADQLLAIPPIRHYAPGTRQNLTAEGCLLAQPTNCRGSFWYHLFPGGAWDTTRYPNGRYLLRIHAWDTRGNHAARDFELVVRN
jgi:murein DD-endopeptidase MepM/ murein hydrolase activator NlpD